MHNNKNQLEIKTAKFWAISLAFNKGEGMLKGISTMDALNGCNELYDNLGSHRTLAGRATTLRDALIAGRKRTKKSKESNVHNLIKLSSSKAI